MASFSLGQEVNLVYSLAPIARTASVVGVAVDTAGYESVAAFGISGAGTLSADNRFALSFKEGDTTTEAAATAIPADRIVGGATIVAANSIVKASVVPMKRYIFVGLVETGTADAIVGAAVLLGNKSEVPA